MDTISESFVADVVENTNMEKRGLFVSTVIDGNEKKYFGIKCSMKNGLLE